MTLWFVLSLMTIAALFAVLCPLARRTGDVPGGSDSAVYRDQLEEIERDLAAGLIADEEAAAAKVEVSRRLIAAADAKGPISVQSGPATRSRRAVAVAVLVLLPLGAAALYLGLGSPLLSDQPLASRLAESRGSDSLDALIAQVEVQLQKNPEDGRGWEVIAPVYLRLGRFEDAVNARRNALRLNGATAERETALAQALVFAAKGVVTAEAKAAFDRALALDGSHVETRYFLGLAAEQEGDRIRAAAIWQALLADAPAGAAWAEFVRRALDRIGGSADGRPAGLSEEQIAASAELHADERSVAIRGMVARLAERLNRDGSDVEGWLRLVRSYVVLGEPDKARAAMTDARRALAGEPAKLQRLDDFARGLGLEG